MKEVQVVLLISQLFLMYFAIKAYLEAKKRSKEIDERIKKMRKEFKF